MSPGIGFLDVDSVVVEFKGVPAASLTGRSAREIIELHQARRQSDLDAPRIAANVVARMRSREPAVEVVETADGHAWRIVGQPMANVIVNQLKE